jgi:hypothetical protein
LGIHDSCTATAARIVPVVEYEQEFEDEEGHENKEKSTVVHRNLIERSVISTEG